ncbi:oxidoreductase [Hyaloraphidium curvatum]|nr:oxidoreductase [Hyaloraphidium curvatum]
MPVPDSGFPQPPKDHTQKDKHTGIQSEMETQPLSDKLEAPGGKGLEDYKAAGKLQGRRAVITGGDSGIGRAVAVLFAKEGADVAIAYLPEEQKDAEETKGMVEKEGRKCGLVRCDLSKGEKEAARVIQEAVKQLGGLDVLVNNASMQVIRESIDQLKEEDIDATFATNIKAMIFLSKHAVPHLSPGSSVINTTSVTAFKGSPSLLDYSSTKGAIVAFTRSLAMQLVQKGIRVNAVAPGPVWTPLQPVSRDQGNLEGWVEEGVGKIGRIGQPAEIAPAYVFLASQDASFFEGQTLHPNGGQFTA